MWETKIVEMIIQRIVNVMYLYERKLQNENVVGYLTDTLLSLNICKYGAEKT